MAVTTKNVGFWDGTRCGFCKNGRFGGTSVLTIATQRNFPEDGILHLHHSSHRYWIGFVRLMPWPLYSLGESPHCPLGRKPAGTKSSHVRTFVITGKRILAVHTGTRRCAEVAFPAPTYIHIT
jgi:hypothetical protein